MLSDQAPYFLKANQNPNSAVLSASYSYASLHCDSHSASQISVLKTPQLPLGAFWQSD